MPLYCTATFVMNITVKFWAEHIGKEKRKCRVWVGGGGRWHARGEKGLDLI